MASEHLRTAQSWKFANKFINIMMSLHSERVSVLLHVFPEATTYAVALASVKRISICSTSFVNVNIGRLCQHLLNVQCHYFCSWNKIFLFHNCLMILLIVPQASPEGGGWRGLLFLFYQYFFTVDDVYALLRLADA
ncbi:MAG: hypothetical protein IJ659_07435, partial [Alloprevotella sp.]|nr:hypothetical protein [Alloprevotella sp.]